MNVAVVVWYQGSVSTKGDSMLHTIRTLSLAFALVILPTLAVANPATQLVDTAEKNLNNVVAIHGGETKKQAEAAYAAWAKAIGGKNAAAIVALYKPDAILLATLKNEPILNQKDRLTYFEGLTKKQDLKVTPQTAYYTIYGDNVAVVSGTYTFSFVEDKEKEEVPARFNFVFEKGKDGKWLIANHHSSKLPID
jgi:uncharacterized protein (TIGR02246 family)